MNDQNEALAPRALEPEIARLVLGDLANSCLPGARVGGMLEGDDDA